MYFSVIMDLASWFSEESRDRAPTRLTERGNSDHVAVFIMNARATSIGRELCFGSLTCRRCDFGQLVKLNADSIDHVG